MIGRLKKKIDEDSSFKVKSLKKTGSLVKGTVLKPKGDYGVDADIAVFLDLSEAEKDDVDKLHKIIRDLLVAIYPYFPLAWILARNFSSGAVFPFLYSS